jgi:hypothetical protein
MNYLYKLYFKLRYGSLTRSLQSVPIENNEAGALSVLEDGRIYRGYFQSELFFKNILHDLASHIRIKKPLTERFNEQYGSLFQNNRVIAVHIRRGDYLELNDWWRENLGSNDLALPADYYLNSLEEVSNREMYKVIFVSDDITFAQETFSHIPGALFAGADMMTDFQILMNADVCIISNSSFAWWAAFLNPKENKQVFCPKYWLGFRIKKEYPENIIPGAWRQIAVND